MPRLEFDLLADAWEEPGDPESVHEKILEAARAAFAADVCTIFPLNPVTGDFAAAPKIAGSLRDSERQWAPPRPDGLTHKILDKKQVFLVSLVSAPEWTSPFSDAEGIVSFAGVVLQAQERLKPLAVLYLDYRLPQVFDENYQQRLRAFSEQASSILQTSWLLNRYRKVIELGQEINQDLDTYENLFAKLAQHTRDLLDTSYFFLLGLYSAQTDTMEMLSTFHGQPKTGKLQPLPPGCRAALVERRSTLLESASNSAEGASIIQELRAGEPLHVESFILAPLLLRDIPLGVLAVAHSKAWAYDKEDLHTLQLLANHVASALNNISLFADLDQISQIGQLLTKQLDAGSVLQSVVDRIRDATGADLVILYPYHPDTGKFDFPSRISGHLLHPEYTPLAFSREGDIPRLTVALDGPCFLVDATAFAGPLGANPIQRSLFQEREGVVSLAAVPLRVGAETVGALYLNFRSRQSFGGSQRRFITGLSVFAATAIKNAWQFSLRGEELAALARIDSNLKRSLDSLSLKPLLTTILEEAKKVLAAEHSAVLLMDSNKNELRYAAWSVNQEIKEGYGLTRWVYEHRETVHVDDVTSDPKWKDLYFAAFHGTRSELDVPLLDHDDNAIGVLSFESPRRAAFDGEHRKFVETLAGQVVVAIQKAQAYEKAERRAHDRKTLFEISQQLVSQLEIEKLLDLILEKAIETTQATAGALLLYDAKRKELKIRAEKGMERYPCGTRFTLDQGIVGRVARERQQRNIDPTDPEWRDLFLSSAKNTRSLLAVPLVAGDQHLWGVLDVESTEPNHFPQRAERLIVALANMAVVALQNAERYQAAEEGRLRLRALQELSQKIVGQSTDPDEVMRSALQFAVDLTGALNVILDLYENEDRVKSYYGTCSAATLPAIRVVDLRDAEAPDLPRGIMAHVAKERRPHRTAGDAQKDPLYIGAPDVHSEICVPLIDEGNVLIGVLDLSSTELYAFDETHEELITLFAAQVVIAIQNARSHENAQRELARFEALADAGNRLAELRQGEQRRKACRIVAQVASDRRRCRTVVRIHDAKQGEFVLLAARGAGVETPPFERMADTKGISGLVYKTRRTQLIPDIRRLPSGMPEPQLTDPLKRSLLVAPILLGAAFYGTLSLSHRKPNFFHEADVKLAEGLAQLLAITFHRLEAIQSQRDLQERVQQAEALSDMGEASAALAHRLGNDLGLIRSYVNDAIDRMRDQGFTDFSVEESLAAVTEATQKVLDLSVNLRAKVAFGIEDVTVFPVSALLEEIREMFRTLPPSQRLVIDPAEGIGMIRAVQSDVVDILINIVKNGSEAMSSGGTVVIRTHGEERSVHIEIEDTGPGIPEQDLDNIFNPFFSTKGSSGFGLWSARRKARLNGGSLIARSFPGRGATFILTLPLAEQRLEDQLGSEG